MGKALILVACLSLAGCVTARGSFCDIADPIRLQPEVIATMSDAAVDRALAQNLKGQKLCGWRP